MPTATLKFDEREITIGEGVTTIGRASDNDVAFPADSNISRYHAEIEARSDEFWLIDLNSSNGTSVNGAPVDSEVLLRTGDQLLLGGSARVAFESTVTEDQEKDSDASVADAENEDASEDDSAEQNTGEPKKSSKMAWLFGCAGITCGLAIVFVVVAVLFSAKCGVSTSECAARAQITKPEIGDIISEPVEIELAVENADCAEKAIFLIDGKQVATADEQPFTAKLNPARFPDLADGWNHNLTVILIDAEGREIRQPDEIALGFETKEIEKPGPTGTPAGGKSGEKTEGPPNQTETAKVSPIETKELTEKVIREQFPAAASSSYKFDPDFWREVQKKTADYARPGFFARASVYKDVINEAYIKEQGLDPALGYIFAMSRTQFDPQKTAGGEGLWRMPADFVNLNGYNKLCMDGESLSDPSQKCAAKASSLYLKELVIGVFEGDVIYSVAAFGNTTQVASIWKSKLPADRSNFWGIIKSPKERDQLVSFFAAAIVARNPEKFGLKTDRPLVELYQFGN